MAADEVGDASQDSHTEATQSDEPVTDAPPSYEIATTNTDNDAGSNGPRSFEPYADEKARLQDAEEDTIDTRSSFSQTTAQRGESSQSSRGRGSNWNSFGKVVSAIAPSVTAGNTILRTRCFHHNSQLRIIILTKTLVQAYDAFRDSLMWEIHSNSSQLVTGNEDPLNFGEGNGISPDGSLVCVGAYRNVHRRLIIIDTETGWIKMEHRLSASDNLSSQISRDNTRVMVWNYANGAAQGNCVAKIFSLVEGQEHNRPRQVSFGKMDPRQAFTVRFAPDNKHLITCAGTKRTTKETYITTPSLAIYIYDEETGDRVKSSVFPYSAKFSSAWQAVNYSVGFHYPSSEEWLLSFPDYNSPEKTCIFNARLGQTVAVFAPQLSFSQRWQGGVSQPAFIRIAYDIESGVFTKMDVSTTVIPRGQTVTITKFALSANGGREKSVVRKAVQMKTKAVSCKVGDICGLPTDGSYLVVQHAKGDKIDIISLVL